jgi:hypothetical protein
MLVALELVANAGTADIKVTVETNVIVMLFIVFPMLVFTNVCFSQ